ncbi:hypothetical protein [Aquimarina spongiae]|uniref:Uncharacterized protein n=1 Tax=Aquimarina spongiae TaxID=570521 RepID=A0A1M6BMP6_9FLAO|nr:hypothetical protein [Aquimarina spongiae]SHI49992.1 hypothetical protein SAMN04488508_101916 [Aquimarina spongiae]
MITTKLKRVLSLLLILMGAIALISEIASVQKNYYIQSVGVVLLMLGLFMVNTKLSSKSEVEQEEYLEEE